MGLGVVNGRVSGHIQPRSLQTFCEGLGVLHHRLLILVLVLVHLIGRHQEAQLGAQVVVGHAPREGPALNGLPQAVFQVLLLVVDADNAPLGAEEGLVGGPGDDLRSLLEGLLEVVADESQHVGHVVHDGGGDLLGIHKLPDGRHGLPVEHHALAENNELRPVLRDDLFGLLHVNFIDIVPAHGEIHNGVALGHRVDGDVVVEGPHRLGRQVAALDDVVVEDVAQALHIVLAVQAVFEVHQGGEHRHVAHLAADDPGFHLAAAEECFHLLHQQLLHLVDELGALVVEHIGVIEALDLLMLGVAEGGVAHAEEPHGPGGGHLRGDQVHAPLLPPGVVLRRLLQQLQGCRAAVRRRRCLLVLIGGIEDGPGVGGRVGAQVVGRDHCGDAAAPDIHLHPVLVQHVAGDVGQTNGPHGALLQNDRLQALPLVGIIGDHGAAGDIADLLLAPVDRHPGPHNAPAQKGDRADAPGQHGEVGEIPVHDAPIGGILRFQGAAAHVIPLLLREAHGEFGHRNGKHGDLLPLRVGAQLVAVEGKPRLQTQGVPGPQPRGLRPQFHQTVPEPGGVGAPDIHFVADGLPGVAGLGHPDGVSLKG